MSTPTTELSGTNGTEHGANGVKNRVRGVVGPVTKFQRLYALAGKAERKTFSAKRDTEEGSVALRMDGFPTTLDAVGVAKLAQNGAKLSGMAPIGAAKGRFTGVVLGATAAEMVQEMTTD
jgi:hypothetical protein